MNIKEYINKKADVIFVVIAVLAVVVFIVMAWQALDEVRQTFITVNNVNNASNIDNIVYNNQEEDDIAISTEWRCLGEDEEAGFYNGLNKFVQKGMPKEYPLKVIVREKNKAIKNEILIGNILKNQYAIEIYKCGIYALRGFNFDEKKYKPLPGFSRGLWKYDYSGLGNEIISLARENSSGEIESDYSYSFRIDPLEHYIVLEKGYMGKENYALIIKDLETKEDVFTLLHSELPKKDLKLLGIFDFREWTKDGKYFWGAISAAAVVPGFFRIDTKTWQYKLFADLPEWIGGGDQLNVETGWVTYHTDMVWTGVHDMTEAIKQERREQRIGTTLYIYNLFTKEKRFIYKTEEPIWFTKPIWLSDTELEYELPSGEKKVYRVK